MSHASTLIALDGTLPEEGIYDAVDFQMKPFSEEGHWFRDGSRWDWYAIGGRWSGALLGRDWLRRSQLTLEATEEFNKQKRTRWFNEAEADRKELNDEMFKFMHGYSKTDTLDQVLKRKGPLTFAVFLRERHWHEQSRLGWWGESAATECELNPNYSVESHKGRCLHKQILPDGSEARIVSYANDPGWGKYFYQRFVKPLPEEEWLVVCDFHV